MFLFFDILFCAFLQIFHLQLPLRAHFSPFYNWPLVQFRVSLQVVIIIIVNASGVHGITTVRLAQDVENKGVLQIARGIPPNEVYTVRRIDDGAIANRVIGWVAMAPIKIAIVLIKKQFFNKRTFTGKSLVSQFVQTQLACGFLCNPIQNG